MKFRCTEVPECKCHAKHPCRFTLGKEYAATFRGFGGDGMFYITDDTGEEIAFPTDEPTPRAFIGNSYMGVGVLETAIPRYAYFRRIEDAPARIGDPCPDCGTKITGIGHCLCLGVGHD